MLQDSAEGVLSLDLGPQPSSWESDLVPYDGGLAVHATLVLRNTGPRAVGLETVELGDTGYAADDVAGRRMSSGGTTSVRLLRRVRCDDLPALEPVGPLRVRAMTGAGMRTTSLRMDTEGVGRSSRFAAAACGRAGPLQSFIPMDTPPVTVTGDRAEVGFELSNASSSPLLLQSLQVRPGCALSRCSTAPAPRSTSPSASRRATTTPRRSRWTAAAPRHPWPPSSS